jgi:hypothetical protein
MEAVVLRKLLKRRIVFGLAAIQTEMREFRRYYINMFDSFVFPVNFNDLEQEQLGLNRRRVPLLPLRSSSPILRYQNVTFYADLSLWMHYSTKTTVV